MGKCLNQQLTVNKTGVSVGNSVKLLESFQVCLEKSGVWSIGPKYSCLPEDVARMLIGQPGNQQPHMQ